MVARDEECAGELKRRTLTNLYNERPTWLDLAHRKLDEAVFAAYGWDPAISDEDLPARPNHAGGLQAVDYFLWALQRLYERGEDRYWEYVATRVSLVYDVDDTRENEYGAYYTKKNPLTLEECKKIELGI